MPIGKSLNHFTIAFSGSKKSTKVLKLPLNEEELIFPGTIDDAAWLSAAQTSQSTVATLSALSGESTVLTDDTIGGTYRRNYANISDYVKECIAMGHEYFYVAVGGWNDTTSIVLQNASTTSAPLIGHRPKCYYSFADVGALELVSSTPAKGEIAESKEATFIFNNKLASATATVDGVEYPCTVNASQVKLSFADAGEYTVQITAKDTARNTVTTDSVRVRVGYESQKLAHGIAYTYVTTSSGTASSTYSPSATSSSTAILSISLPTLEAGKKLKEFKLKFITVGDYSYEYYRLVKIPVDPSQVMNLVCTTGETPEGKINIKKYVEGAAGEYKADFGNFKTETTDLRNLENTGTCYAKYADLTAYANECIERGQTKMLVGFTSRWTNGIIGVGDSSHTNANRFHYTYWTTEDADFSAKAPKFVAADDAKTFAEATGLSALAKEGTYKCLTSLANFGDDAISATLYVAQYNSDGELISLAPKAVTVPADGVAADYAVADITIDANTSNVKAFIWNDAEQKPMLIGDVIVEAK